MHSKSAGTQSVNQMKNSDSWVVAALSTQMRRQHLRKLWLDSTAIQRYLSFFFSYRLLDSDAEEMCVKKNIWNLVPIYKSAAIFRPNQANLGTGSRGSADIKTGQTRVCRSLSRNQSTHIKRKSLWKTRRYERGERHNKKFYPFIFYVWQLPSRRRAREENWWLQVKREEKKKWVIK